MLSVFLSPYGENLLSKFKLLNWTMDHTLHCALSQLITSRHIVFCHVKGCSGFEIVMDGGEVEGVYVVKSRHLDQGNN